MICETGQMNGMIVNLVNWDTRMLKVKHTTIISSLIGIRS